MSAKRNGWITIGGIITVVAVILLAFAIWGGLKIAGDRGEQARKDTAVQKAQDKIDEIAKQEQEKRDAEAKKAEEEKKAQAEKDEEVAAANGSGGVQGQQGAQQGQNAGELPQTGPTEQAALALGAMTFVSASYVASRRILK